MPTEPRHPLAQIKDALVDFFDKESQLARAELTPAVKSAGISATLFAGAALFLAHAVWMLVIVIGLGVGLLLHSFTPMGPWGSFTLGFTIGLLLSLMIAAILILLGLRKYRQIRKPEATIAEAKATLDTMVDAITSRERFGPPVVRDEDLALLRDEPLP